MMATHAAMVALRRLQQCEPQAKANKSIQAGSLPSRSKGFEAASTMGRHCEHRHYRKVLNVTGKHRPHIITVHIRDC